MKDLVDKVFDFFEEKYGNPTDDLDAGRLFLAFESAGREVLGSDFKLLPGDAEPNPTLISEYGSHLVDFTADIDEEGYVQPQTDLSPSVSGQYEALLNGARPRPGDDPAAFLALLGRAKTDFENHEASLNLTHFWPARLAPQFWFDDRDPAAWSRYDYSEGAPAVPAPPRPVGRPAAGDWRWRVLTPATGELWKKATDIQRLEAKSLVLSELHSKKVMARNASERRLQLLSAVKPMMVKPSPALTLARGRTLSPTATVKAAVGDTTPAGPPADIPVLKFNSALMRSMVLGSVIKRLPTKAPTSTGFKMSFQYRVVDVARPWLSAEFLRSQGWYLAGADSGSVASGKFARPAGPMSFLPAKFIVTKSLRISANWSEEDRVLAGGKGVSLGPFTFVNGKFQNDELSDPGMKIIGWLCQVAPMLPPQRDPALPEPAPLPTPVPAGG